MQKLQLLEALEDTAPNDMDGSYLIGVGDPLLSEAASKDAEQSDEAGDGLISEEIPPLTASPRGEKRKHAKSMNLSSVFEIEDEILLSQSLLQKLEDEPFNEGDGEEDGSHDGDWGRDGGGNGGGDGRTLGCMVAGMVG